MRAALEKAKKKILGARDILISGHFNPDGDSIGSLLSLGLGLEQLGKKVYLVSRDGVPKPYRHLPAAKRIKKSVDKKVDLAISVDCSTREILGETFSAFKKAKSILEIDHHHSRRPFGDLSLVDPDAAAVGELIYLLLEKLNVRITQDIAENILTSVIVETNSFRLPNLRPFTFELCARLLKTGIDFHKLADTVYWSKTKEALILTGICLSRSKFLKNGRLVYSIIRKSDFKKARGKDEDADAVAEEMRCVKGVKIVLLFREKNKEFIRVSLRSKGKINVAALAENCHGGGHFDVAGCYIPNNQNSVNRLLTMAKKLLG